MLLTSRIIESGYYGCKNVTLRQRRSCGSAGNLACQQTALKDCKKSTAAEELPSFEPVCGVRRKLSPRQRERHRFPPPSPKPGAFRPGGGCQEAALWALSRVRKHRRLALDSMSPRSRYAFLQPGRWVLSWVFSNGRSRLPPLRHTVKKGVRKQGTRSMRVLCEAPQDPASGVPSRGGADGFP